MRTVYDQCLCQKREKPFSVSDHPDGNKGEDPEKTVSQSDAGRGELTEVKKYIALIVAVMGFVLLFGTAGACDAGMITLSQTVVRGGIAVVMMFGGAGASYIFERREG